MTAVLPVDDDADVIPIATLRDDEIADSAPVTLHNTTMTTPLQQVNTAPATATVVTASSSPPSQRSKFKVVFLGDQSVGKTSIVTRFVYDKFDGAYKVTIGIDFVSKSVAVPNADSVVRLQLWDTAGQERFRSLIPSYIRDCDVAVIVFDLTNRASYDSAWVWLTDVRAERGDDVACYVVGNKCDSALSSRSVSPSEAVTKCAAMSVHFAETSALSGQNVARLFDDIAVTISELSTRRAHAYMGMHGAHAAPTAVVLTAENANANASYCAC